MAPPGAAMTPSPNTAAFVRHDGPAIALEAVISQQTPRPGNDLDVSSRRGASNEPGTFHAFASLKPDRKPLKNRLDTECFDPTGRVAITRPGCIGCSNNAGASSGTE